MPVEEEVGGVEGDVVARHVPDTLVLTGITPGILDEIIGFALLVKCLAVDEHHMVIGEAPVVPLFLTKLLRRLDAIGQHGQTCAGEVA